MTIRGYVLVATEVGLTNAVGDAARQLTSENARILAVDTVTGPFDVIVHLVADNLDALGDCITKEIQKISGVQRTTTCLSFNEGSPVLVGGRSNGALRSI